MRLIAFTPDLFFSTRIQSTLERAGHSVRIVERVERIAESLAAVGPALAILDIGAAGVWDWEALLKSIREAAPALPVLAYGSHTNVEATKLAQSLGAVRVVAKSEFVNNMVNLVERYAQSEQS